MNIGKHFRHSADPNCVVVPYREGGTHVTVFVLDDPKHDLNGKSLSIGGLVEVEVAKEQIPMIVTNDDDLREVMERAETGRIIVGEAILVRDRKGWHVENRWQSGDNKTYARWVGSSLMYFNGRGNPDGYLNKYGQIDGFAVLTHYFGATGLRITSLTDPPKIARAIFSPAQYKVCRFYEGEKVIDTKVGSNWTMTDEQRADLLNRCTRIDMVLH